MNWHVLSDTHFGHEKMKTLCGRPSDFGSRILKNLKTYVNPGDVVIHLGDFCIGNDRYHHEEFMCTIRDIERNTRRIRLWLVKGNHDRKSTSWYLSQGWDFVADEVILQMFGETIHFTHKPQEYEKTNDPGYLNIHGHEHNTRHHTQREDDPGHLLVYMEHEYRPLRLSKMIMKHRERDFSSPGVSEQASCALSHAEMRNL